MNVPNLNKLYKSAKQLTSVISLRELQKYANDNFGLELFEFNPDGPMQKVLVLAASPGDDAIGCGGVLCEHIKHGDTVRIVYLADGGRANPSGTRDRGLVEIREAEAKKSADEIGAETPQFWRFSDDTLDAGKTITGLVHGQIDSFKPDIIYIPWYGEDDSDRRAVSLILFRALNALPGYVGEVWQYELSVALVPNRLVAIGNVIEQKIRAIDVQKSQAEYRNQFRNGILGLNTFRGAVANLDEPAEGFLALPAESFKHFCQHLLKFTQE